MEKKVFLGLNHGNAYSAEISMNGDALRSISYYKTEPLIFKANDINEVKSYLWNYMDYDDVADFCVNRYGLDKNIYHTRQELFTALMNDERTDARDYLKVCKLFVDGMIVECGNRIVLFKRREVGSFSSSNSNDMKIKLVNDLVQLLYASYYGATIPKLYAKLIDDADSDMTSEAMTKWHDDIRKSLIDF